MDPRVLFHEQYSHIRSFFIIMYLLLCTFFYHLQQKKQQTPHPITDSCEKQHKQCRHQIFLIHTLQFICTYLCSMKLCVIVIMYQPTTSIFLLFFYTFYFYFISLHCCYGMENNKRRHWQIS